MSLQLNNTDNQLNIITNGVLDVYNVKTIKSVSRAVDASGNHYISINFIANDKNNSLRIPLTEVTSPVGWTNDTPGAIVAVEDIRDWLSEVVEVEINEANDSILVYGFDGATNRKIKTDINGELQVDILTMPATFAEDSAHVSGNIGSFVMGVNNNLNTPMTSANGDYSPIAVNNNGAVAIQDGGSSITVDGTITANAGTGNFTVVQATASNLNATVVGGVGVQRTPAILRTSASSSVAAGKFSMSFASVGTVNATVGGFTLKPGETINFDAGAINNTLGAVVYDSSAVGAELLIITLT